MRFWLWRSRRNAREEDLKREIEWHLQEIAEEKQDEGLSAGEASQAARRDFGNATLVLENTREVWVRLWLARLAQDVRFAFRVLARTPGFTSVAVLVFALGIGANTAVFSLIDLVMLRALPVDKPEQLANLGALSYPFYRLVRDQSTSYQGVFAYSSLDTLKVSVQGEAETASGAVVSGNYFPTLGVGAARGRLLSPQDDQPTGAQFVAVISDGYWRRKFAADPEVVGRSFRLNDRPYTIIGVIDPDFHGLEIGRDSEIIIPIATQEPSGLEDWGTVWLSVAARLKPGVSTTQAAAELTALSHNRPGATRSEQEPREAMKVEPFSHGSSPLEKQFAKPLTILMGAVGLVLIIACANLANLLLARAEARRKEMAVRLAIGAGKVRLVRQLLTEGLILAAAGTALGLLFAQWSCGLLLHIASQGPRPLSLELKPRLAMLAFAGALALVTTLMFGLAPAIRATRVDPYPELKSSGSTGSPGGSGAGPGRALVVCQIAMSVALVIGAGLLARTLGNLRSFNAGFERDNILLFAIEPATSGYQDQRLAHLYTTVLDRLRALPGIKAAGMSRFRPMTMGQAGARVTIAGDPNPGARKNAQANIVDPGFFEALRLPVILGRGFERQDTGTSSPVAVINETLARQYFPGQDPVGRRFKFLGNKEFEVAGVARDARYHDLREEPVRMVYLLHSQQPPGARMHFEIRASRDAASLAPEIRAVMRDVARDVPVVDVNTLTEQIDRTLLRERLLATLSAFFAGLGLIVAAAGLYGMMAYRVARRRAEIGIRVALGAQRRDILHWILGEALLLVTIGAVIGLAIALPATSLLASMLFGLARYDPATITMAIGTLFAVSVMAAYLPARRALRIDAMTALRYE